MSVYDTPVESIEKRIVRGDLKTPQICVLESNHPKYTVVSSITTSEKKYEKEFAERSVLGDSFYSPSVADKTDTELEENVSCAPLRPSTGKKSPRRPTDTDERPKLSVRLKFENRWLENADDGADLEKSVRISSSTSLSSVRNAGTSPDNRPTYCSGLQTVPRSLNFENRDAGAESHKKRSNESNEIDFVEPVKEEETLSEGAGKNVRGDGGNVSKNASGTDASPDCDVIPDSCDIRENTTKIRRLLKTDLEAKPPVSIERPKTPVVSINFGPFRTIVDTSGFSEQVPAPAPLLNFGTCFCSFAEFWNLLLLSVPG